MEDSMATPFFGRRSAALALFIWLQAPGQPSQSAWVLPAANTPYNGTVSGLVTDTRGATLTISMSPTPSASSAAGRASATLPAESFRGRRVVLRGELQTRGCAGCSAALWMRLDKSDGILFGDSGMDRAVRSDSDWTLFSVTLPVPQAATTLIVGLTFQGGGAVTARAVRLESGAPVSPDAPVAPAAKAELDAAIGHVRKSAWMRDNIDWAVMNDDLRFLSAGAEQPSDVYLAIRYLLAALKDRHSFLMPPAATKAFQTGGVENPPITVRALGAGIGYVDVPAYGGADAAAARAFATHAHERLAAIAGEAGCGWIVDLRNNGGGNMWPMLAGLKPFLGDEPLGTFISREGASPPWKAGQAVGVDPPASLRTLEHAWVAVLTGPLTASSGEAVTISFKGRPRTRSFGHPTTGLSSGNGNFPLPDGAMILLTTVIEADRTGKRYGEKVDPDDVVAGTPVTGTARGQAGDATMAAASAWLKQACQR
jgi:carboxyl-terminal processing protease